MEEIRANCQVLEVNNKIIIGHFNQIFGKNIEVRGCFNRIRGDSVFIIGDHNKVKPSHSLKIQGNNNTYYDENYGTMDRRIKTFIIGLNNVCLKVENFSWSVEELKEKERVSKNPNHEPKLSPPQPLNNIIRNILHDAYSRMITDITDMTEMNKIKIIRREIGLPEKDDTMEVIESEESDNDDIESIEYPPQTLDITSYPPTGPSYIKKVKISKDTIVSEEEFLESFVIEKKIVCAEKAIIGHDICISGMTSMDSTQSPCLMNMDIIFDFKSHQSFKYYAKDHVLEDVKKSLKHTISDGRFTFKAGVFFANDKPLCCLKENEMWMFTDEVAKVDEVTCKICKTNMVKLVAKCGHTFCGECSRQMHECPFKCSNEWTFMRIYL